MKHYLHNLYAAAAVAVFLLLGFFPAMVRAGECTPERAGGAGKFFTTVMQPQAGAVIYAWWCPDGLGYTLVALDRWKPLLSDQMTGRAFFIEFTRLKDLRKRSDDTALMPLSREAKDVLQRYEPTPAQRRKLANEHTVI
jgi:hypothetical protein